jgi:hypothetical protein
MDELTELVNKWTEIANTDEEWECVFRRIEFRIKKHIIEKIGKKISENGPPRNTKMEIKGKKRKKITAADIQEVINQRDRTINDAKIVCDNGIEVQLINENYEETLVQKISIRLDKMHVAAQRIGEFQEWINNEAIMQCCDGFDFSKWFIDFTSKVSDDFNHRIEKMRKAMKQNLRSNFAFDGKATMNGMLREPSERCKVKVENLKDFWGGRWSNGVPFDETELTEFFKLEQVWNEEQGKIIMENL